MMCILNIVFISYINVRKDYYNRTRSSCFDRSKHRFLLKRISFMTQQNERITVKTKAVQYSFYHGFIIIESQNCNWNWNLINCTAVVYQYMRKVLFVHQMATVISLRHEAKSYMYFPT